HQGRSVDERRSPAGDWIIGNPAVRRDGRNARLIRAELGVEKKLDAAPGPKNFILVELDGVADVDVEQIVADEPGGDLGRPPGRVRIELLPADLQLEQIVACGRGLE